MEKPSVSAKKNSLLLLLKLEKEEWLKSKSPRKKISQSIYKMILQRETILPVHAQQVTPPVQERSPGRTSEPASENA